MWAAVLFLVLFVIRLIAQPTTVGGGGFDIIQNDMNQSQSAASGFDIGRKNYASSKRLGGQIPSAGPQVGPINPESQKYEKIANLTQVTNAYDDDRKRIDALIAGVEGIVQLERAIGLKGGRVVQLGIGVPPEKFDAFIDGARAIGRAQSIEIIKNDKTNEYLQLRAKRDTLVKARTALEELKAGGGSTAERVNVQTRLTEVEQQIQDLGVSLGEFDSQNELCTVKLALREAYKPVRVSFARRTLHAFELALADYLTLAVSIFALMASGWLAVSALAKFRRMMSEPSSL